MEVQLNIAQSLFSDTTKVIYCSPDGVLKPVESGEVQLEAYKLDSCPDTAGLIAAISKKCSRVKDMKRQKHSAELCVALLASRGYCITSLELKDVPDVIVEMCWESLQNIQVSVDEPLKSWLAETIGDRSYLAYGLQFCQRRFLSSSLEKMGSRMGTRISFKLVPKCDDCMPQVMWHRDDAVYSTASAHFGHETRDISDDP